MSYYVLLLLNICPSLIWFFSCCKVSYFHLIFSAFGADFSSCFPSQSPRTNVGIVGFCKQQGIQLERVMLRASDIVKHWGLLNIKCTKGRWEGSWMGPTNTKPGLSPRRPVFMSLWNQKLVLLRLLQHQRFARNDILFWFYLSYITQLCCLLNVIYLVNLNNLPILLPESHQSFHNVCFCKWYRDVLT